MKTFKLGLLIYFDDVVFFSLQPFYLKHDDDDAWMRRFLLNANRQNSIKMKDSGVMFDT